MKVIIISTLIVLLNSCHKKEILDKPIKQDEIFTMNSISNYDSIVNLVKNKGNVDAYNELFYYLMDSNEEDRTDTLMYYSRIMAEKYNNNEAYKHYFNAFSEKYKINSDADNYSTLNLSSLQSNTKKQAEYWLKKMLKKKIITQEQYDSVKR